MVANPALCQLNREIEISLSPFAPKNLAPRDRLGLLVPRQYVCMYVCMVTHVARVRINRVRLPILLVVS